MKNQLLVITICFMPVFSYGLTVEEFLGNPARELDVGDLVSFENDALLIDAKTREKVLEKLSTCRETMEPSVVKSEIPFLMKSIELAGQCQLAIKNWLVQVKASKELSDIVLRVAFLRTVLLEAYKYEHMEDVEQKPNISLGTMLEALVADTDLHIGETLLKIGTLINTVRTGLREEELIKNIDATGEELIKNMNAAIENNRQQIETLKTELDRAGQECKSLRVILIKLNLEKRKYIASFKAKVKKFLRVNDNRLALFNSQASSYGDDLDSKVKQVAFLQNLLTRKTESLKSLNEELVLIKKGVFSAKVPELTMSAKVLDLATLVRYFEYFKNEERDLIKKVVLSAKVPELTTLGQPFKNVLLSRQVDIAVAKVILFGRQSQQDAEQLLKNAEQLALQLQSIMQGPSQASKRAQRPIRRFSRWPKVVNVSDVELPATPATAPKRPLKSILKP